MKYEKGITTSSVIIYVIAITIVIATFSVISSNFYNSLRTINNKNAYSKKYTEFTSNFEICNNIQICNFYYEEYNSKKGKITVEFKSGDFDKTGNEALTFYIEK